jgi:hypothetical protein
MLARSPARSVLIGTNDLAAGAAADRAVHEHVDRLLDEVDGPIDEYKVAAAGVVALEACVRVGTARGPVIRAPTVAFERTALRRWIVDRNGGAIGARVPLPNIVVGTLSGQALSRGDGVACAIGDTRKSHGLTRRDVKHAAEYAGRKGVAAVDIE